MKLDLYLLILRHGRRRLTGSGRMRRRWGLCCRVGVDDIQKVDSVTQDEVQKESSAEKSFYETDVLELRGVDAVNEMLANEDFLSEKKDLEPLTTAEKCLEETLCAHLTPQSLRRLRHGSARFAVARTIRGYCGFHNNQTQKALQAIANIRQKLEPLTANEENARRQCADLLRTWHGLRLAGTDGLGHPVLIERVIDAVGLLESLQISDETLLFGRVCALEVVQAVKCLLEKKSKEAIITKHIFVVDMTKIRLKHATKRVRLRFRFLVKHLEQLYPDSVYRTYVINAPSSLNVLWTILGRCLDPETRAKVRFLNSNNLNAILKADGLPASAFPNCSGQNPGRPLFDFFVRAPSFQNNPILPPASPSPKVTHSEPDTDDHHDSALLETISLKEDTRLFSRLKLFLFFLFISFLFVTCLSF